MEWLWTVLLMLALVAAAITAIALFQRSMSKPGAHHDMATMGGALSGLDEVFNPHAAQARLEREEQSRQRAPIPSPGDLPQGVVFEMDDDGVPTKVVIRAPRRAPEGGGGPAGEQAADCG
ncbi:hypothetical protein ART_1833 [Arthrobacter sp. PAMC 25486]|uniref:hypothetical protein n=1 Tax=Arthrobacter sp. PAMC 25486 TaxID=1494608 RepID=UPI000535FD27|nr:hypothetical protein [Arthrobacter sp. PAMC 25486]AIY01432.1 hypothetical protein ART_1833 [Arthrobacter sp. PAMC 25486]